KTGTIKFGIIGVIPYPEYQAPDYQVTDAVKAIKEILKRVKPNVDYTILLAALNEEDKRKF
ncbi:MAG: hypothetical protein DRP88_07355, partial [Candidatus Neomarinimicrobiota bacterium]